VATVLVSSVVSMVALIWPLAARSDAPALIIYVYL
jgi:hypothetical protein